MDRKTHIETTTNTGIFTITECTPAGDMAAFAEWLLKDLQSQPTFWGELEAARLEAREILGRHGLPADGRAIRPNVTPPVCEDAAYVSSRVDEFKLRWKDMDKEEVAFQVLHLATVIARMRVRPFEPAAVRGRKQLEGASKGGKARANQPKQQRVRARFNELRRADPSAKVSAICSQLEDEFKVSQRTVHRYRKSPESADGASHSQ